MNSKAVRRGLAILAILVVTGGTGLAVANAHSIRRHLPQDDVHPKNSMCFSDGEPVKGATIWSNKGHVKLGKIELFYSPACRTAWARVETLKPSGRAAPWDYVGTAFVERKSDGQTYQCIARDGERACNTHMVNDADVKSFASGTINYKMAANSAHTDDW